MKNRWIEKWIGTQARARMYSCTTAHVSTGARANTHTHKQTQNKTNTNAPFGCYHYSVTVPRQSENSGMVLGHTCVITATHLIA